MYQTIKKNSLLILVIIISILFIQNIESQTRKKGPWWPNPLWGIDDQAGGSNWITPEKVLEASKLVKIGEIYELGFEYSANMPIPNGRSFTLVIPGFPTGGVFGPSLVHNDEFVTGNIGQIGTQFDGPGHIGKRMKMADGTIKDIYYNGVHADEMASQAGFLKNGVENVKPIITKGILIDIATLKGVETLENGYKVTLADVLTALKKQGISQDSITPGDAIIFNFGWWKKWPSIEAFEGGWPGITPEVADWVISKKASMVGSDAPTDHPDSWIVHEKLMLQHGIWNLEYMNLEGLVKDQVYEFMFIFTPLKLKGATGSPGNPIAIH